MGGTWNPGKGPKGGQTQSLQESRGDPGENRRQSLPISESGEKLERKGKNAISRERAIPSKKVTGRERGRGGVMERPEDA